MSYKGEDKWSVYGDPIISDAKDIHSLRRIIKSHVMSFVIDKAKNSLDVERYKITNVSVVIKKEEVEENAVHKDGS